MASAEDPKRGRIIDGRALARQVREEISRRTAAIREIGGAVRLDAVLAAPADSPAGVYAESQGRACAEVGVDYHLHRLAPDAGYDEIAGRVLLLNTEEDVSGIMVHLPLPEPVDAYAVQRLIAPEKDVEGVNPANIGNIVHGRSSLVPCTALATVTMVESTGLDLRGLDCVVVGASDLVGKPVAVLLMRDEATVVSCNKHTKDLLSHTRRGDVLIAAAGVPGLITPDMVKPGAVVVDVGTTRITDESGKSRTVGDVAFDDVRPRAGWISPVPGGVGPMTVAMLLRNVVDAAERRSTIRPPTSDEAPGGRPD